MTNDALERLERLAREAARAPTLGEVSSPALRKFDTEALAALADALPPATVLALLEALRQAQEGQLEYYERRNAEVSMLAHRWMVAHDSLKAGKPYDYPSPADLPAAEARALKAEEELRGRVAQLREVEQIAGRALGYPWFKDDQKNFPGATEADGVCIGEHVAETIVEELAARALKAPDPTDLFEALEASLVEGTPTLCLQAGRVWIDDAAFDARTLLSGLSAAALTDPADPA